jgi:DNA-binding NarL/FixJ family response regulator
MRILIAEDETIIRLDLRDMLVRAGFEVCGEARDGEEAVELARSEEPDLAIMDVKMPKLDGIDAARRILEERPIPIVMLTAYGQAEIVSRAVEAGVSVPPASQAASSLACRVSQSITGPIPPDRKIEARSGQALHAAGARPAPRPRSPRAPA